METSNTLYRILGAVYKYTKTSETRLPLLLDKWDNEVQLKLLDFCFKSVGDATEFNDGQESRREAYELAEAICHGHRPTTIASPSRREPVSNRCLWCLLS